TTYHAGAQRDVQSAGGAPAGCSEKSVDRVAARAAVEGRNVSSDSVSAATNASANGRIRLSACVIAWELLTGRATAAAHRRDPPREGGRHPDLVAPRASAIDEQGPEGRAPAMRTRVGARILPALIG